MFYHSLISDWNHGNAHFLRGIVTELICRGETVEVYEPKNSWSFNNLIKANGENALHEFHEYYPKLNSIRYDFEKLNLNKILKDADLVIVHEWNEPELVNRIGNLRDKFRFKLFFHDTHHRIITDFKSISKYNLSNYDGVLAYGNVIRDLYLKHKLVKKAWTWHEAADVRLFHPMNKVEAPSDLIWIGNWGDDERTNELEEFLITPVKQLGLKCRVHGVRYPDSAIKKLKDAGIEYGSWLPNFKVPELFSRYRFTIHVPRKPYVEMLPGIPTIRPFEALACGIPLISALWKDEERLFNSGKDFLIASSGEEMEALMKKIIEDDLLSANLSANGIQTIRQRHTCTHRVDELYRICEMIAQNQSEELWV